LPPPTGRPPESTDPDTTAGPGGADGSDPLGPPPGIATDPADATGTADSSAPPPRGDLTAGAGDVVAAGGPPASPRVEREREAGRRTVAAAATVGLAVSVALGAVLGARERAAALRATSVRRSASRR
jgi:hypothetical protein